MNHFERISRIQSLLKEQGIEAWLFFDFRGSDPIAYSVLGLDPHAHSTRRWLYLVLAEGDPIKIVHRIESGRLDALPGRKLVYLEWGSLHSALREALAFTTTVAMQYSENAALPYVSRVDAGTIELIRKMGVKVISSADLIQGFESVWTESQLAGHRNAAAILTRLVHEAFDETVRRIRLNGSSTEMEIQDFLVRRLAEEKLITDFPPIVAVNHNAGNPHYAPTPENHAQVLRGDLLLIDIWAKETGPDSVYADITWTAFLGMEPPARIREVFETVRNARDAGIFFLTQRFADRKMVHGWEVDDVVRAVIRSKGYGKSFVHRTGHNLGTEVHGNGVHFDNLETHDTREVIRGIACTIEPGIYLHDFGIRSEINLYFGPNGPEVTTPPQTDLLCFDLT